MNQIFDVLAYTYRSLYELEMRQWRQEHKSAFAVCDKQALQQRCAKMIFELFDEMIASDIKKTFGVDDDKQST